MVEAPPFVPDNPPALAASPERADKIADVVKACLSGGHLDRALDMRVAQLIRSEPVRTLKNGGLRMWSPRTQRWASLPRFTDDVNDALALIAPVWWLHGLREMRSEVRFAGDQHESLDTWECSLQHQTGGRLTKGVGGSPARAIVAACGEVSIGYIRERWTA